MKTFLTAIIFLQSINLLFSQDFISAEENSIRDMSYDSEHDYSGNNNLYFEGSFVIQSINIETKLYRSNSNLFQMNGRLGLSYFYLDVLGVVESFGGLAGLTFLLGRKNNHFETFLGGFMSFESNPFAWPVVTLGYKYQKPEGGFIFRSNLGTLGMGIGLGYAF